MPVINGITVPDTTKNGEWVQGRQYWNGTLSEPGVINPLSNQQGAGQLVSKEVNIQSDIAQGLKPGSIEAYLAAQRKAATAGTGAGGTVTGGATLTGTVTGKAGVNLISEQQKLYDASGITDINKKIADLESSIDVKKTEADKRRAEVNENPFLSEASRVGQIAKIDSQLNDSLISDQANLANLQGQVTTKNAEINTKLGLITQQFDMDKAVRAENLSLFNALLSSGALTNATAADLTALSLQTGIPVSFIQSSVTKNAQANVQIETATDNAGNVTFVTLDKNTGKIVSQVSAGTIGKGATSSETASDQIQTVGAIISSYINNEQQQAQISPENLHDQLVAKYGLASDYIEKNWTADQIREATGG